MESSVGQKVEFKRGALPQQLGGARAQIYTALSNQQRTGAFTGSFRYHTTAANWSIHWQLSLPHDRVSV
ncbi:hypothetical protein EVAR_99074_1 [Eumeta japonica]|uniref:Uncharacterized protein n=1 Tax=Eumeta variegata TaxID=151549 RepID=A0A4C1ZJX7_EUMVA|nr:hypothetical protein EVAR_99074_1 [Eumeta japonica]